MLKPAGSRQDTKKSRATHSVWIALFSIIIIFCLPACSLHPKYLASDTTTLEAFLPPTMEPRTPTPSPTPLSTPTLPRPTARVNCSDDLEFVDDLTIPDKMIVAPSSTLDKRWQVKNNGTCNWDNRYKLRLSAGPDMGAASEQALFPARSGSIAVIRILFTAPNQPGTYRSAWQAVNPDGKLFGTLIYIEVVVK